MISIEEMKNFAAAEKEVERKANEVKFQKDLAIYRDKLKTVRSKFMDYIQQQIMFAIKWNRAGAELHNTSVAEIFSDVASRRLSQSYAILWYLCDAEREAKTAYETAIKEMAESVRNELLKAGVKEIKDGGPFAGDPDAIIVF